MIIHGNVNYLAVLLCGVIAMAFGSLWYSPFLFGKIWADSLEKTEDDLKKDFKPFKTYSLSFLGHLVMAYALARVMTFIEVNTFAQGVRLAFLCWVGFTAATMFINSLFEGKKIKLLGVDAGYHLIIMLVYGAILSSWQV